MMCVCVFGRKTIAVLIPEPTGCKTLKTEKRRGELTVVNINNLEMHWFYAHTESRAVDVMFLKGVQCVLCSGSSAAAKHIFS